MMGRREEYHGFLQSAVDRLTVSRENVWDRQLTFSLSINRKLHVKTGFEQ